MGERGGGPDVAVIGLAGRYPGARDITAFWQLIERGDTAFGPVPADRWRGSFDSTGADPDRSYTDTGAFLDDIAAFAARDYAISARRAQVMDPQQRLLLQAVTAAIEDAGYAARAFDRQRTSVFVGASVSNYKDVLTAGLRAAQMATGAFGGRAEPALADAVRELVRDVPPPRAFTMTGTLLNMAAAAIGQTFGFGGPSVVLDAACSSSLVAVSEALLHLRAGTCSLAVAGGVHLALVPDSMIGFSRIGAISRAGRCRPFDAAADGFVLGEGVGVVLLKRLADARADGDKVYAVVKGAGASNDGRSAGPMTPSVEGQASALQRAYADAAVDPRTIGYLEAHGTGTAVGDVTEVTALRQLLPADRSAGADGMAMTCWLGSVKANVGHTMAAAGIAGLLKTVGVLSRGVVPPQPTPFEPDPRLELADSRFAVPTSPVPWIAGPEPRRAGVSSFGFGGTNVHVVLEEASDGAADEAADGAADEPASRQLPQLLLLHAPTRELLAGYAAAISTAVEADVRLTASTVAAELATRATNRHRLAIVAADRGQLRHRLGAAVERLADPADGRPLLAEGVYYAERDPAEPAPFVTFAYPGQGSQQVGALGDLHRLSPTFRQQMDQCDAVARAETGVSPLGALYPATGSPGQQAGDLARTEVCQPALAAASVALTDLLASVGIRPNLTVGHSLGEFCAAAGAGVLEPADLIRLVARRGAAMAALALPEAGTMLAVGASRSDVEPHLADSDGVWIANLNSDRQVVLSGHTSAVARVRDRLRRAGLRTTELDVSHAFHTPLMAPIDSALEPLLAELVISAPITPVVSAVTGEIYGDQSAIRARWQRHASAPVDFTAAMRTVAAAAAGAPGAHVVIQVGVGRGLLGLVRAGLPAEAAAVVALSGDEPDEGLSFVAALALLAVLGCPVDPTGLARSPRCRPAVTLPPTPQQTEQYWPWPRSTSADPPPVRAADAVPSLQGEPMSDLVALFREQTEVLRLQAAGADTRPAPAVPTELAARAVPPPAVPTGPPARAIPPPSMPAKSHLDPHSQAVILDLVSRTCAFPPQTLKPQLSLVGDLGFDSLMLAELGSALSKELPELAGASSGLTKDVTVGELLALVAAEAPARGRSTAHVPAGEVQAVAVPTAEIPTARTAPADVPESAYRFGLFPELQALSDRLGLEQVLNVRNPYFSVHERVVNDTSVIGGREVVNFSSYNYLGMSGDPAVSAAAIAAIERYGTSVSASRLLSGEKPLHGELERELARLIGTEDCVAMVSGHATNVTVIGHLVGPDDLILHDALAHDSILQGCRLSGAVRRPFPHADWDALDRMLTLLRPQFRRVLIAIEGVYSMDGDVPDLPRFLDVKRRHHALLYIDEAHSIGTMGPHGGGIGDHFGTDPAEVDIWMGTLSKSLASCGGYVAGSKDLVRYLKYTAPGFIYSVGLPPPSAAASLAALEVLRAEPERVRRLHERARLFLDLARAAGVNTGPSSGTPVVPAIVGSSVRALRLSAALLDRGINVNPILHPAVEENQARLRFFVTASHSEAQIRDAVAILRAELAALPADDAPVSTAAPEAASTPAPDAASGPVSWSVPAPALIG